MTLIRLLAAQTFTLGIALDALSSQVQAAIVKDVLSLADEYDVNGASRFWYLGSSPQSSGRSWRASTPFVRAS